VKKKIYNKVKCDRHVEGFWTVDAWKTDDLNEEGKVIALINDVTGAVYEIGEIDDTARGVIDEVQTEIVNYKTEILAELYGELPYYKRDEFLTQIENL
jgi:hypothetical protein